MCISKNASITSFIIGIIGSILLYYFGNKKYNNENKIYSLFLFYVIIMQLFDYIFWIDQDNKKNLNYIFSYIAPLFNYFQPSILYILKLWINNSEIKTYYDKLVLILNIIYVIISLFCYKNYINDKPVLTIKKGDHLNWKWIDHISMLYYVLFIINIFYKSTIHYSIMAAFIIFCGLYISSKYTDNFIGEIWCFIASTAPLFFLIGSYSI
jgi:hypothetical protein